MTTENINSLVVIIAFTILLLLIIMYFAVNKVYTFVQSRFLSNKKVKIAKNRYISNELRENFSKQDNVVSEEYMKVSNGGPLQPIEKFEIVNYGNNDEFIVTEEDLRFWYE